MFPKSCFSVVKYLSELSFFSACFLLSFGPDVGVDCSEAPAEPEGRSVLKSVSESHSSRSSICAGSDNRYAGPRIQDREVLSRRSPGLQALTLNSGSLAVSSEQLC